jgi:deazaflavin-dependent oxidoreductase (nitroreductase family)
LKKTNPNSSSKTNNYLQEKYLYLTTRGRKTGKPREIEIWFTCRAGRFYVIAEYAASQWVKNLQADANVRVRVGGELWTGKARIIQPDAEPELNAAIQELSRRKFGWGEGLVIELIPDEPIQ